MAEPALKTNGSSLLRAKWLRLRLWLVGIAQDYWYDGSQWPFVSGLAQNQNKSQKDREEFLAILKEGQNNQQPKETFSQEVTGEAAQPVHMWKADRVHVMERLWGEGCSLPGGDAYIDDLTKPLGLNHEMSVLDLGAGLGALPRRLAELYKSYVSGMEQDPLLAARGMIMSIAAGKSKHASIIPYDPAVYTASRKYDCVIAREVFYKLIGKDKFFKAINTSLKGGGGQLVFTDYILEAGARNKEAVSRWLAKENAAPMALIETVKEWKQMGYDVRVMEDQTEEYRHIIVKSLASFMLFLDKNKPDEETKRVVIRELDLWVTRLLAFEQGLKYYRFYAIKR